MSNHDEGEIRVLGGEHTRDKTGKVWENTGRPWGIGGLFKDAPC